MNEPKLEVYTQQVSQILFPHPWQLVVMRNPTYWRSAFIGLTSPVLNLPLMLWHLFVVPLFRGVYTMVGHTWTCLFHGLCGNVVGLPIPAGAVLLDVNHPSEDGKKE